MPFPRNARTCEAVVMPSLQIDLEDGFSSDTVVVYANGRELWRQDDVTTNPAVSVAAIARVEVPEGARIEVHVPTRRLSAASQAETPYLEVEIAGGGLFLRPSDELPRHL